MAKKRKQKDKDEFIFKSRKGNLIWTIFVEAFLGVLLFVTWNDKQGAWVGDVPLIFIGVTVFFLYFLMVFLVEGWQTFEIGKDELKSNWGIGPFHKEVQFPVDSVSCIKDDTTIFSLGRKYSVYGGADGKERIRINGTLSSYNRLLKTLVRRISRDKFDTRAIKSLQRSRIIY